MEHCIDYEASGMLVFQQSFEYDGLSMTSFDFYHCVNVPSQIAIAVSFG